MLFSLASNNQETDHIQTQTTVNTKVALINNDIHTKTYANRKDRQSLVYLPFMTFDQETEQVYSYNPGVCTGLITHRNSKQCTSLMLHIT